MIKCLLLAFVVGFVSGWSSPDLNELIDELIDLKVRPVIVQENLNELKVGDVNYEFSQKIWLVTVYGSFRCTNGKISALTTVYRTGDADAAIDEDNVSVEAPLGLRVLVFSFDRCSIEIKDIFSFSAPVSGKVASSSIDLKVVVTPNEKFCTATIDRLYLLDLSGISITTGNDIFAKLRDNVFNGVVWRLRGFIEEAVDSALKTYEKRAFNVTKYCTLVQGS